MDGNPANTADVLDLLPLPRIRNPQYPRLSVYPGIVYVNFLVDIVGGKLA